MILFFLCFNYSTPYENEYHKYRNKGICRYILKQLFCMFTRGEAIGLATERGSVYS